jgi:hypothetical protein
MDDEQATEGANGKHWCDRCHHESNRKGDLIKHLQRKNLCDAIYSDIPCQELIKDIRLRRKDPVMRFTCSACEKCFKTHQGIYQHKKHCELYKRTPVNAPASPNVENERKRFGRESSTHMTSDAEFMTQCVRRREKGVIEFIEGKHMSAAHPENHNIRVTNIKMNYVQIFDGSHWMLHDKDEIIDEMVIDAINALHDHFDDITPNLQQSLLKYHWMAGDIQKFFKEINNKKMRKKMIKKICKKVFISIINFSRNYPKSVQLR